MSVERIPRIVYTAPCTATERAVADGLSQSKGIGFYDALHCASESLAYLLRPVRSEISLRKLH